MLKLFIPAYVLDKKLRQCLATGDTKKAADIQAMLLKHETGAARIQRAHSDHFSTPSSTPIATP